MEKEKNTSIPNVILEDIPDEKDVQKLNSEDSKFNLPPIKPESKQMAPRKESLQADIPDILPMDISHTSSFHVRPSGHSVEKLSVQSITVDSGGLSTQTGTQIKSTSAESVAGVDLDIRTSGGSSLRLSESKRRLLEKNEEERKEPKPKSSLNVHFAPDISKSHDEMASVFASHDITIPEPDPKPPVKVPRRFEGAKGLKKFKKVARVVKTNLMWSHDAIHSTQEHEEKDQAFTVTSSDDEVLTFNLAHFKAHSRAYGGISSKAQRILVKASQYRTEEDLNVVQEVVDRLKCFEKYSKQVRHELARVITMESYEDGRIIIQQGHIGLSFYFIVSGSVVVKMTDYDKETGQKHTQILGSLSEGSTFGELALLHNIRRTATIVCKGNSSFLRIDKADFDDVLSTCYKMEWEQRFIALRSQPLLKKWTFSELEECNYTSRMMEWPKHTLIWGNITSEQEYVHFVNSGEIKVVRDITLLKEYCRDGKTRLRLPSKSKTEIIQTKKKKRRSTVYGFIPERHLWQLLTLTRGYFFGVGEDLTDTYLVTATKVECVLVPVVEFMKCGRARLLEEWRRNMDALIPDNKEAFKRFIQEENWEKYKEKVVLEVVGRRSIPNSTTRLDVPREITRGQLYSTRISPSLAEEILPHALGAG